MKRSVVGVALLFAATLAVVAADVAFVVTAAANYPSVWPALNDVLVGAIALVFGSVGVLIIVRRRNAVGWLMSALGLLSAAMAASGSYGRTVMPAPNADLSGAFWLAPWWVVVGGLAWLAAITLLTVFIQVFPDGRPLSPRWRLLLVLTFGWPLLFVVASTLSPLAPSNGALVPNPAGLRGPIGGLMIALTAALGPVALLTGVGAIISVILRARRSVGRQRAQLKVFAYAAAVVLASMSLSGTIFPADLSPVANSVIISVLPLSVAAAILRHGLYDIDIVIERTLVYGATTAAIGVTFFVGIVVLQATLRPLTGGSELAVAASTLLSFALFQPLRRRVQVAVDKRFYRSRYDAARTLDQFSVRLRDEVDLDAVRAELIDAVQGTVQPTHASVWLR